MFRFGKVLDEKHNRLILRIPNTSTEDLVEDMLAQVLEDCFYRSNITVRAE